MTDADRFVTTFGVLVTVFVNSSWRYVMSLVIFVETLSPGMLATAFVAAGATVGTPGTPESSDVE